MIRPTLLACLALTTLLATPGCEDKPCRGQAGADGACQYRVAQGAYTVVWLYGTPYEMGFQHGTILHEEIRTGVIEVEEDAGLAVMFGAAKDMGLLELALEVSYPEIVEECQGMVDAAGDVGWTMDHCMLLNTGDMVAEFFSDGKPAFGTDITPGCTQIVARGEATVDGRLYHARVLDWSQIDFIVNHPTIFVRQPDGGLGHVVIGFPGNLSPYQGMNEAGVAISSNEVRARDNTVHDATGRSHVQLVGRILTEAHSLAEARTMVTELNHMTLETLVVSDGNTSEAEVFEMAPAAVGIRTLEDDHLFAVNHFVAPETIDLDQEPTSPHTAIRWDRLVQLVTPDATETYFGTLEPATLAEIMRDRVDAWTGEAFPADTFDNGRSIATNGALYQVVYDPAARVFWVAAGAIPVPQQPLVGFSLLELLGKPGSAGTTPATIP